MLTLTLDIETFPMDAYLWSLWDKFIPVANIKNPTTIACWSAKWYGSREIMFSSVHDKYMLDRIWNLLNETDVVIHQNGKTFDVPMLNTEFVRAGMVPPMPYKQIDLLDTSKRIFRFPSNKLEYIVQDLKIGKKIETEGMPLWIKCMNNDKEAWGRMERYNKNDVRLTEKLYEIYKPWIVNHPNAALYSEDPGFCCTVCESTDLVLDGYARTSVGKYHRYRCNDCGKPVRGRKNLRPKEKDKPLAVDIK